MANKDTAKQWFETGDKPTQTQFWQVFDWLRWNDIAIAIDDISGLSAALASKVSKADYEGNCIAYNGPAIYTIPASHLLESIVPYYAAPGDMQISLVAMGNTDEANEEGLAAGWNRPIYLNIFAENNTDLYIDGIPPGSKLVFLTRKIKMNP